VDFAAYFAAPAGFAPHFEREHKSKGLSMFKEIRFIVTFYNTAGAMAFKQACEERSIEGHLMPIPKEIKAGCGMVWSAPLTARKPLMTLLEDPALEYCERLLLEV
jgi:hypothetical protein